MKYRPFLIQSLLNYFFKAWVWLKNNKNVCLWLSTENLINSVDNISCQKGFARHCFAQYNTMSRKLFFWISPIIECLEECHFRIQFAKLIILNPSVKFRFPLVRFSLLFFSSVSRMDISRMSCCFKGYQIGFISSYFTGDSLWTGMGIVARLVQLCQLLNNVRFKI